MVDKRRIDTTIQRNLEYLIITILPKTKGDYSILLFDIDYFKAINDLLGYRQGDAVVNEVDNILNTTMMHQNMTGVYGRYGGDEFIVALPVQKVKAGELAETIRKAIENHCFEDVRTGEDLKQRITGSLGIATVEIAKTYSSHPAREVGKSANKLYKKLLSRANVALDYAKFLGRNRVEKFGLFLQEEWQRIQDFRRFYIEAIQKDTGASKQRLNRTTLPKRYLEEFMEETNFLKRRVHNSDTRTIIVFSDSFYRRVIYPLSINQRKSLILELTS